MLHVKKKNIFENRRKSRSVVAFTVVVYAILSVSIKTRGETLSSSSPRSSPRSSVRTLKALAPIRSFRSLRARPRSQRRRHRRRVRHARRPRRRRLERAARDDQRHHHARAADETRPHHHRFAMHRAVKPPRHRARPASVRPTRVCGRARRSTTLDDDDDDDHLDEGPARRERRRSTDRPRVSTTILSKNETTTTCIECPRMKTNHHTSFRIVLLGDGWISCTTDATTATTQYIKYIKIKRTHSDIRKHTTGFAARARAVRLLCARESSALCKLRQESNSSAANTRTHFSTTSQHG